MTSKIGYLKSFLRLYQASGELCHPMFSHQQSVKPRTVHQSITCPVRVIDQVEAGSKQPFIDGVTLIDESSRNSFEELLEKAETISIGCLMTNGRSNFRWLRCFVSTTRCFLFPNFSFRTALSSAHLIRNQNLSVSWSDSGFTSVRGNFFFLLCPLLTHYQWTCSLLSSNLRSQKFVWVGNSSWRRSLKANIRLETLDQYLTPP